MNSDYANNTFLEPTIWDLKIIFGEFSQRLSGVDWHTAITVPWAQAKLLSYYLQVNVAAHEIANGKIQIPEGAIPAPPPELSADALKDPKQIALFDMLREHRQRFVDGLK